MQNLLAFLTKYYHWFIFLLLEVASGVMLFRYNSYQGSMWVSSTNMVTGQIFEWESEVTQFVSLITRNEELTSRNLFLEQEVGRLRQALTREKADTTAFEKMEMALLSEYQLLPAKVVSNSVNKHDNLLTIDKGTADGVAVDMGVACGTGLVGVVYLTSEHYSVVIPALNTRSRISVTIRDRGYFGYLTWDGRNPLVAYVEDVPRHARFEKGDWVVTSGYSAIYPAGISVGKIIDINDSADGLSYRLMIQLSTDFANLRDVCVITQRGLDEQVRLQQAAVDSLRLQKNF